MIQRISHLLRSRQDDLLIKNSDLLSDPVLQGQHSHPKCDTLKSVVVFSAIVVLFSAVFLLVLNQSMARKISGDENQFVASGKLLAEHSLIPYRDYPYFHMPNLVFIYAMLFTFTDHILLAARMFSVACVWLTFITIFFIAFFVFRANDYGVRLFVSAASVALLIFNPLFTYTSGLSWNHDAGVLFILLSFLVHCSGLKNGGSVNRMLLSGALLGVAAGIRLTFAPTIAAFILAIFFTSGSIVRRSQLACSFGSGLLVALLPSIVLFATAPEQFIFGNVGYSNLAASFWLERGAGDRMTAWGRLKYFLEVVVASPASLLLFLLFTYCLFFNKFRGSFTKGQERIEVPLLVMVILTLLIGSFAPPSPGNYQYFYAPMVFVLIGAIYGMAGCEVYGEKMDPRLKLFGLVVAMTAVYGGSVYENWRYIAAPQKWRVFSPEQWVPMKSHQVGVEIASVVGRGRVLTLAPIYPLEGGLKIFESLATGRFAWRTGHLLSADERERLRVMCKTNLLQSLGDKRPDAILVGVDSSKDLEEPLEKYARENRYQPVKLRNDATLFVSSPLAGFPQGPKGRPIK